MLCAILAPLSFSFWFLLSLFFFSISFSSLSFSSISFSSLSFSSLSFSSLSFFPRWKLVLTSYVSNTWNAQTRRYVCTVPEWGAWCPEGCGALANKLLPFQLSLLLLPCTQLTFHLAGDPRPRLFHSAREDSIQVIGSITAQLKNVFPITQLE